MAKRQILLLSLLVTKIFFQVRLIVLGFLIYLVSFMTSLQKSQAERLPVWEGPSCPKTCLAISQPPQRAQLAIFPRRPPASVTYISGISRRSAHGFLSLMRLKLGFSLHEARLFSLFNSLLL